MKLPRCAFPQAGEAFWSEKGGFSVTLAVQEAAWREQGKSPANPTAGGCPASLLLQSAIKIHSAKLLVRFFTCVSQV